MCELVWGEPGTFVKKRQKTNVRRLAKKQRKRGRNKGRKRERNQKGGASFPQEAQHEQRRGRARKDSEETRDCVSPRRDEGVARHDGIGVGGIRSGASVTAEQAAWPPSRKLAAALHSGQCRMLFGIGCFN